MLRTRRSANVLRWNHRSSCWAKKFQSCVSNPTCNTIVGTCVRWVERLLQAWAWQGRLHSARLPVQSSRRRSAPCNCFVTSFYKRISNWQHVSGVRAWEKLIRSLSLTRRKFLFFPRDPERLRSLNGSAEIEEILRKFVNVDGAETGMLLWKQFERPRTTTYLEFSLQRAWHRLRAFPAFLFGYSIHCLRHVLCLFLERVWFFHTHFFCATRCSLVWFTMLRTTLLRTCDDHWTVTREVVVWRWKGTLRMTCCHRRILPRQWWVNLKKHFTVVYEPLADVLQCVTDVLLCAFSTRCYRKFFSVTNVLNQNVAKLKVATVQTNA